MSLTESTGPELSIEQETAARRYERAAEASQANTKPEKRMMAQESYVRARRVLEPSELAIVDLVLLKGRALAQIAAATGRDVAALEGLYLAALDKLSTHFEQGR